MENYFDDDNEVKKGITVGKVFKWLGLAVFFVIMAILTVRCTFYSDDPIVKKVLVNDDLKKAYSSPDFMVEQYGMKDPYVVVKERRMIEFNHLYHIAAARQLQFSVKYNTDVFKYISKEDKLPIKFKLVDNYGDEYTDYFFEQKSKFGYNYIRLCFEGIDLIDYNKQPDEDGIMPRKTYMLYVYKLVDNDGNYEELCYYQIYDGKIISKEVDFKL